MFFQCSLGYISLIMAVLVTLFEMEGGRSAQALLCNFLSIDLG